MNSNKSSPLIIGMALFAMFFGSGNLIYPLYVGQAAQEQWMMTSFGFLIAAVLLPFLGVAAMVMYKGNYSDFFNTIGKIPGFLLSALLLTVWIPLGSGPRCMILSHASLKSYADWMPDLWVFSLIYSAIVFIVITRQIGVLDILGKWITPLLLACITVICFQGYVHSSPAPTAGSTESMSFVQGMMEGYNTMDLIASFFFSASVIHMLNQAGGKMGSTLSIVLRSSIVGMVILAVVYICLISLSAHHAGILEGVPKDQMLAFIAQSLLGPTLSFVAILAILLACFSTSVALILAYTDFLHEQVFRAAQHPALSVLIALGLTFLMSLFGLEGVTAVTSPVFKICYPFLLFLILFNMGKKLLMNRQQAPANG